VPERSFAGRRRGPIASINVWLAAALLRPRTAAASVMAAITAALLINLLMLVLMKPAETLFLDCTEAYAWGRQFLFGYGRHPPVTGWIAGVWYRVFPAENWASYALSQVMTGISLVSIYFIGKHVLGRRRATLVVFAMLLYPLFVGGKSDHYNNAQVLLAILPLTVWMFLRAYEKPALSRGLMLGLAAAASMLTYYSATFGLLGLTLAAVMLPGRRNFFTSPAPYAAIAAFVLALIPHAVWLANNNFSTLHWVDSLVEFRWNSFSIVSYLAQQFGLLAFCLIGAAIAVWPWRFRKVTEPPRADERAIVTIVATVLVLGPVLLALARRVSLQLGWGNSLFFLVPIAVASFLPMVLVTRRAVVVSVWIAAISCPLNCSAHRFTRGRALGSCPMMASIAHSAKPPRKSRSSGANGSIRRCRLSLAALKSPRQWFFIAPTIRRCSRTSFRPTRRGSIFPTSSFTKDTSAFAWMMVASITRPA